MARLTVFPLRGTSRLQEQTTERPADSLTFDRVVVILAAWHTAGVFLDGWAHQHVPSLETFFTPWHAVLYSGYLAVAIVILAAAVRNLQRGYAAPNVLPKGYGLALIGVIIFAIGGVADLVWHTLFGIEADVEALLGPTHLMLALGMTLILTGPVRAAYHRKGESNNWAELWPALLALTFVLSLFAFFTQYADPFGSTLAATAHRPTGGRNLIFLEQALGVMSILGQTALLMGNALFAIRRWRLPFGSITLLLGLSTLLMTLMRNDALGSNPLSTGPLPLIAAAIVSGLFGDFLVQRLNPFSNRPGAYHAIAFVIPAVLYALYFGALFVWGGGIWWSIHMWAGAIFLAGIVGLLLSYAMMPPSIKENS